MKKWLVIAVVAVTVFSAMAVGYAEGGAKPEKGIIVGNVIEITTYAMKGLGEDTVEGAKHRAETGFPVGILEDGTGIVWIATYRHTAPASHLETANELLAEYVGMKVAAQGLKYTQKGANVVRLSVVSEY